MGKLTCLRCGATIVSSTASQGRKLLDHSIGLSIGRPCGDNRGTFSFEGSVVDTIDSPVETTIDSPTDDIDIFSKPKSIKNKNRH